MVCEPTFEVWPAGDETTGQDCCDVAAAYGVPLDGWQQDLVRRVLRESAGTWSCSQAGLVLARQNGKGQVLLAIELFGLFVLGETIMHTSHAVKTSSDAFRRLWFVIEAHPDLKARVRRRSEMTGAEFVELDSGARISFSTRSASTGRGLSIDRLVIDEAEDFPSSEVGALAPTTFARPRSQTMYTGTAPGVMVDSESFRATRQAAHENVNPRLGWSEWCAEWGSNLDDRELWVRVNPAVASGRVPIQKVVDDRSSLPVDQFRAERLSMFAPTAAGPVVFDPAGWEELLEAESFPVRDLAIGVDAPPSRDAATVCLAGRRDDGKLHLEWYETNPGLGWLPPWVGERLAPKVRAVVVDSRNPCAELDWTAAGVRPTLIGTRDVSAAAGALFDGITDSGVRHRGQVELTRGVLGAVQRPMAAGQGFGWDRKAPGSSVLLAASLAVWGVDAGSVARPRRGTGQRSNGNRVGTVSGGLSAGAGAVSTDVPAGFGGQQLVSWRMPGR